MQFTKVLEVEIFPESEERQDTLALYISEQKDGKIRIVHEHVFEKNTLKMPELLSLMPVFSRQKLYIALVEGVVDNWHTDALKADVEFDTLSRGEQERMSNIRALIRMNINNLFISGEDSLKGRHIWKKLKAEFASKQYK